MTQTQTFSGDKATEWIAEVDFIHETWRDHRGRTRNFNHDTACFLRYVEMQANSAAREGFTTLAAELRALVAGA